MDFWTEVHWSEGMFLRPHHLQAGQRNLETLVRAGVEAVRPFPWGFVSLEVAPEPLENFTLRLDRCELRLKDGTWVRMPENTQLEPLNFQEALDNADGPLDIFFGVPQMQEVRPNSVPLEHPESANGNPRYEPHPIGRRDENTGENSQVVYVRRMRGKLFTADQDLTGYEVVRLGQVFRSDRPGAVPEFYELSAGPLLAIQADNTISALLTSLSDEIKAKDEVLAREAREHSMRFTDGVADNTEHLLKTHVLNETRAHMEALLQCPVLHPYDVFVVLCRLIGHLSIFHNDLVPGSLPVYDHDRPGESFEAVRGRLRVLLEAMRPINYVPRPFIRKKDDRGRDGLEVELDRRWIDENLELFVGMHDTERDINELERWVYATMNFKLASPSRTPRIVNMAVRGLRMEIKSIPSGRLPRRDGLHYFKIDKTIGPDRTDYWKECEQERGIRIGIREGQLGTFEALKPTLFVVLKERS